MEVIIIDDEILSIHSMEKILNDMDGIRIVGKCRDWRQALDVLRREKIDLIFCDIELPEKNGIELAELMMDIQPDAEIAFVTAYDTYAVEAFELNAIDYVLKPVQKQRIAETVSRVQKHNIMLNGCQPAKTDEEIHMICSMNYLALRAGKEAKQFAWRTRKAQELFAYLLHHRGHILSKNNLTDLLWPDASKDKTLMLLHTTIYQVRRLIREEKLDMILSNMVQGYRMDLGKRIELDVDVWEKALQRSPALELGTLEIHQRLMQEYQGDYLAEHGYLWAESEKERLRNLWLQHTASLADFYLTEGIYEEGIRCYQTIKNRYPYLEDGYFGLMRAYASLGYNDAVANEYQTLVDYLHSELALDPKEEIICWYNDWQQNH